MPVFFSIFPIVFVVLSIGNFDYEYVSYETMTYSSADSLFEDDAKSSYFLGYEAKFNNAFNDGEFIYNAIEKSGLSRDVLGDYEGLSSIGPLKKLAKILLPDIMLPESLRLSDKEITKEDLYDALVERFTLKTDESTRSFNIAAYADNPSTAQRLAQVMMDAFVVKMYEDLLLEVKAGKQAHLDFIEAEKEKIGDMNQVYGLYEDDELAGIEELNLSKQEKVALKK